MRFAGTLEVIQSLMVCRPSDAGTLGEPIDAVYTWVNGSDPAFIASKMLHKHNELRETDTHEVHHSL